MSSKSDEELEDLLREYRNGSVEYFDIFFRKTKHVIYRYVRHRVSNPEIAQDIVQEVYFRVHRYILSFDAAKGSAIGWLRTIANNAINDHLGTQKIIDPTVSSIDSRNSLSEIDISDQIFFKEMIEQFYKVLDADDFNILMDRLVGDISFNEIAERRGIRSDHARQKFSRTIKKLKEIFR